MSQRSCKLTTVSVNIILPSFYYVFVFRPWKQTWPKYGSCSTEPVEVNWGPFFFLMNTHFSGDKLIIKIFNDYFRIIAGWQIMIGSLMTVFAYRIIFTSHARSRRVTFSIASSVASSRKLHKKWIFTWSRTWVSDLSNYSRLYMTQIIVTWIVKRCVRAILITDHASTLQDQRPRRPRSSEPWHSARPWPRASGL